MKNNVLSASVRNHSEHTRAWNQNCTAERCLQRDAIMIHDLLRQLK